MADKEHVLAQPFMPGTRWREAEHPFNLSRHLIPFLQDVPFYAELSRHIPKRFTFDIPTAAVTYDPKTDDIAMYVNPVFMAGGSYVTQQGETEECEALSNSEIRGVLTHEFKHLVFGHLNARVKTPDDKWGIATDLAINSLIDSLAVRPRDVEANEVVKSLPRCGLIPGKRPWIDPKRWAKLTQEQQARVTKLSDLIETMPTLKASEWYFHQLLEKMGSSNEGGIGIGSFDDHSGWGDIPEEMREYIEGKVKGIIEKAVRHADSHADGWGNIPQELREDIRRSISNIINWRAVLRQFVGSLVRGNRSTSIKRINKRYPYIHPGIKRGYEAKLLVAIDQSGSVSDEMLELFFAELASLAKKVSISVLHFDCGCDPETDLYEWRKGTMLRPKRTRSGGTNFDAPTRFVNDPKNRGRWDGMLILTDGQAPAPMASRIKRGWVLAKGCKLDFSSHETQIFLSKEQPMQGAWR